MCVDKKAATEPFRVSAIYHDDRSPTSAADAREKPALYELKDGKPSLINFQLENGVYIAPKILDSGYLAVGKKKLTFTRRTAAELGRLSVNEPIQDKSLRPPGLLPKHVQSWLIVGLAVLMVLIMWLTGSKKPKAHRKQARP